MGVGDCAGRGGLGMGVGGGAEGGGLGMVVGDCAGGGGLGMAVVDCVGGGVVVAVLCDAGQTLIGVRGIVLINADALCGVLCVFVRGGTNGL